MTFAFKPAMRERTPLLIGIGGQSGSGKTYSALELATGLGGRIAAVDTERGRMLHYAGKFRFDHVLLTPPFTPERYRDAIEAAEEHVGDDGVVVVDSMSHEWEGVGGMLEMAHGAAEEMAKKARTNGQQYASAEQFTFPSWREPKQKHQRTVNRMLQLRCHLICCFRAKEKMRMVEREEPRRDGKGTFRKREVESVGVQPIMEENLPYEMTMFAILHPGEPGVPRFTHKALMEDLRPLFPEGEPLGRTHGERLARWAAGAPASPPRERRRLVALVAADGSPVGEYPSAGEWLAAFRDLWASDRPSLTNADNLDVLRRFAPKADEAARAEMERLALDLAEDLDALGGDDGRGEDAAA